MLNCTIEKEKPKIQQKSIPFFNPKFKTKFPVILKQEI